MVGSSAAQVRSSLSARFFPPWSRVSRVRMVPWPLGIASHADLCGAGWVTSAPGLGSGVDAQSFVLDGCHSRARSNVNKMIIV